MKRGSTDAETCRLNGWGPGTRLTGEENGRSATITITAIGRASVLAIRDGWSIESVWSLVHREWRLAAVEDHGPTAPTLRTRVFQRTVGAASRFWTDEQYAELLREQEDERTLNAHGFHVDSGAQRAEVTAVAQLLRRGES